MPSSSIREAPGDRGVAIGHLRAWRKASKRTGLYGPVPTTFLRAEDGGAPLARMIRAGRADVRLGIYLCLLLRATAEPYTVRQNPVPAVWAEMLCLADPRGSGARRVSNAFKWLKRERLVGLERRAGRPPEVVLLDPSGTGQFFTQPHRWVNVPIGVWERGWIFALRETSLAMLLVLLDLQYGKLKDNPPFVTAEQRYQYGLSDDTWARGTKDLKELGLLEVGRRAIGDDFHFDRLRNTYWVDESRLGEPPPGA